MQTLIQQLAKENLSAVIAWRRHLHRHPELSYQEFNTSKFIQSKLEEFQIPNEIKVNTGVIGLIKGKNPTKKVIALRADMDALPIHEENDVPYRSCVEGVMHACGHDVHTA
ncbi:MAG: M20/M25/M40 family metallo-hydrolase, partial [Chitinophagaceae bacterium]|nr:M20/M25/M40 family metallo-hydrolase [Chitinophagaceae bacterium]